MQKLTVNKGQSKYIDYSTALVRWISLAARNASCYLLYLPWWTKMERLKICGRFETPQFIGCGFSHMISIGDHDDIFDGLRLPEIAEEYHL